MYLIAGLGNPEKRYAATRHNDGFEAAFRVHEKENFPSEHGKFQAMVSLGKIGNESVALIRPMTYMNLSGRAVRETMNYYQIPPENVIVIYDDVSLPFGTIRVRRGGSAGGHNGMKNIIAEIGSQAFPRVRIGVGEKPEGWDLADYVLSHFTKEEIEQISRTIDEAADAAISIITNGVEKTMNIYNTKGKADE